MIVNYEWRGCLNRFTCPLNAENAKNDRKEHSVFLCVLRGLVG